MSVYIFFINSFVAVLISSLVSQHECTRTCYINLGCLETNSSWFSSKRPFNPDPSTREQINTTFQLYTITTKTEGEAIFTDFSKFESKNYFKDAEHNFFLIHGFRSWGKADWILEIKGELLRIFGERVNVFSVDWSGHGLDYAQTAADARVVGLEVARFVSGQPGRGLGAAPSSVHLVGHSLGAHVAGYVGERIPGVRRITGLDPAGQHFAGMPYYVRLDPTDAQFVDVIHTDTQGYGTKNPMGHIDFYANGEGDQPGCGALNMLPQFINQGVNATLQETGTCAHSRAHQYFVESLQTYDKSDKVACKFVAYACKSYQDLNEGKCVNFCNPREDDSCKFVGLDAKVISNRRNVVMYFKTANFRPYCMTPYKIYIDVGATSAPVMYAVVMVTLYDSKGVATSWTFNDGYSMPLHAGMTVNTLIFSTATLTSNEVNMVNIHWNSRFYPFGLIRKALVNGYIKIKSVSVRTLDGKRVKLCPRAGLSTVEVYEYEEVMFYVSTCGKTFWTNEHQYPPQLVLLSQLCFLMATVVSSYPIRHQLFDTCDRGRTYCATKPI